MDKTPPPLPQRQESIYLPPATDAAPQLSGQPILLEMEGRRLKKLRNNSQTIRGLGLLGILSILGGIWLLLFAFPMGQEGGTQPSESASTFMSLLYFAGGLTAIIGGILGFICGYFRPAWGKVGNTIQCSLYLLNFPLGTLLGVVGLLAVLSNDVRLLYGKERILFKELESVYKQRKKAKML